MLATNSWNQVNFGLKKVSVTFDPVLIPVFIRVPDSNGQLSNRFEDSSASAVNVAGVRHLAASEAAGSRSPGRGRRDVGGDRQARLVDDERRIS